MILIKLRFNIYLSLFITDDYVFHQQKDKIKDNV